MDVLLLGSIGVLAETSDLQRAAYNDAFASHGVPWHWSREAYAGLLSQSGGLKRLQREARRLGQSIDAEAVHAEKSKLFQQRLAEGLPLRPGVAEAMQHCPALPSRVLVTGGGRHNPVLMEMLRVSLDCPVAAVEEIGLDGDMLEAQAFAYLAVRVARGLPTSCPGTTGVRAAVGGGIVSLPQV